MPEVDLTAGTLDYEDTGGDSPIIVLLHGLLMDGAQWRHVVTDLRADFRCVMPTLPMGAHRRPMRRGADLSLRGLGRIVAEFLTQLDLRDVTLCFNDWCGAQVMIADGLVERVGRLVLVSCEALENYPPGLPGRLAAISARLPGGVTIMRRAQLVRRLRQLPMTFGSMSKRHVPNEVMQEWMRPLADRKIRRDYKKYAATPRGAGGTCSPRQTRSSPSTVRCWSYGRPRTESCPSSTGDDWSRSSRTATLLRSPTATHSSPKTNRPYWPRISELSPQPAVFKVRPSINDVLRTTRCSAHGIEIAILTSPHVLAKGPALVLGPRGHTNCLMW
jgi:pimeloyl-ACP methyl ester carboxylesterase